MLSNRAKGFIAEIESKLHIPVTIIGTGPGTLDVVDRRSEKLK
jgi:adenylosuccinate synthase